jgi:hypothetical protein
MRGNARLHCVGLTFDAIAVVIDAVERATLHPEHEPLDELLK